MNPDVADAIPRLVERGLISADAAQRPGRAARGELVSVRAELQVALYCGVLLVIGGVSWLVRENLDRIGPATIAAAIALAAAGLFFWVARRAPAFTWGEQVAPHLAFDYLLLLAVLLVGADLAYIEWKFTPLGASWPWHLLLMSALAGALAVRYDSRTVFSLSLASFAAWRGVAVSLAAAATTLFSRSTHVAWNALACGLLFVALGWALVRTRRKAHFEPVAAHLGWLLALGAMATLGGVPGYRTAWALLLLGVGVGLTWMALRQARFGLIALGVVGAYVGLCELVVRTISDELFTCAWFFWTALGVVVLLVVLQRRLRSAT